MGIGVTLVELEPEGDILPVRAAYDPESGEFGIGVNPFSYEGTAWYALPDVVGAAVLAPGRPPPRIRRALRLVGRGVQPGLETVRLRGGGVIDPRGKRDPFLAMIEERARVRADEGLDAEERERLQLFLKITANGTSYGGLARFDRRSLSEAVPVLVNGPDDKLRERSLRTPEDPGPFCFPPVAASITAGARLMLALLERLVTDAAGAYAFCDTDSMAIVAAPEHLQIACPTPDGTNINALSYAEVEAILGRFDGLDPYESGLLRPWKVEHESLERPLHCYAFSAKRYCLVRLVDTENVEIVAIREGSETGEEHGSEVADWSEHGLGGYADPTPDAGSKEARDEQGRRIWIRVGWEVIIRQVCGLAAAQPEWAAVFALTSFTVSTPQLRDWFGTEDDRRVAVRPGSFGLMAHPDRAFYETRGVEPPLPVAPYEDDPKIWPDVPWVNRRTGKPIRLVTAEDRADPERFAAAVARGDAVVETIGRVLGRYVRRPEHKSLAPDGGPAGPDTVGLLRRRPVRSTPARTYLMGKEGNLLEERAAGLARDASDYRNYYGTVGEAWEDEVLPRLRKLGARKIIELTGLSRSAVYAVLAGTRPRGENRARYEVTLTDEQRVK